MLLFQSNKKKKRDRLWRARVKQPTTTSTAATTTTASALPIRVGGVGNGGVITGNTINNMVMSGGRHYHQPQQFHQIQHQSHPMNNNFHHSDCSGSKCSIACYSNQLNQLDSHNYPRSNCSIGERSDTSMIDCQENYTSGYCYESTGSITDYDEDQSMLTIGYQQKPYHQLQQQQQLNRRRQPQTNGPLPTGNLMSTATAAATTISTTMALTAANVFRNCCGGGFLTDSTLTINSNNNNYNNYNNNNIEKFTQAQTTQHHHHHHHQHQPQPQPPPNTTNMNEDDPDFPLFRTLIKKLKDPQLATLCQTIDLITSAAAATSSSSSSGNTVGGFVANAATAAAAATQSGHQPDCVLVPRGQIMGEEPNAIACRLWRWPDLRNSLELKSIPACPNERDRVYVCCNPSHWSRICSPDTPPPPYQSIAMERLKPEERAPSERMKGGENSNSSNDSTNSKKHGPTSRVQFPGSLTTDGEDSSLLSSSWCELAYWELAQRVGGRFPVENSSINIFWDQFRGDGMCLKTLAEQRQKLPPDSVIKARLKIGLGVTLSQEADGVWLYNRSSAPVFVHSPTLNNIDNWFNVTKVPPGYCLKAFDNYKAKTKSFVWPPQIAGAQTGPVDTMSMRISFAKGWGPTYTRQDVTACPCWLEVLLTRNR